MNEHELLEEIEKRDAYIKELEEWKFAVEEACIVDFVDITTPEETIFNLIQWNVKMALDPSISKDANELIAPYKAVIDAAQKARYELVRPLKDGETIFESYYRAKEILRTALEGVK